MPGKFYRFPGHAGFVIQRRRAASAASDGVTLEVILVPWAPNMFLAILNFQLLHILDPDEDDQPCLYGLFLRPTDGTGRPAGVQHFGEELWTASDDRILQMQRVYTKDKPRLTTITVVHKFLSEIEENRVRRRARASSQWSCSHGSSQPTEMKYQSKGGLQYPAMLHPLRFA